MHCQGVPLSVRRYERLGNAYHNGCTDREENVVSCMSLAVHIVQSAIARLIQCVICSPPSPFISESLLLKHRRDRAQCKTGITQAGALGRQAGQSRWMKLGRMFLWAVLRH
jgi:hypothetical protein